MRLCEKPAPCRTQIEGVRRPTDDRDVGGTNRILTGALPVSGRDREAVPDIDFYVRDRVPCLDSDDASVDARRLVQEDVARSEDHAFTCGTASSTFLMGSV